MTKAQDLLFEQDILLEQELCGLIMIQFWKERLTIWSASIITIPSACIKLIFRLNIKIKLLVVLLSYQEVLPGQEILHLILQVLLNLQKRQIAASLDLCNPDTEYDNHFEYQVFINIGYLNITFQDTQKRLVMIALSPNWQGYLFKNYVHNILRFYK